MVEGRTDDGALSWLGKLLPSILELLQEKMISNVM